MSKRKNIVLLGATGSIGKSTLEVLSNHLDHFNIIAVTAHTHWQSLAAICRQYQPQYAVLHCTDSAGQLRQALPESLGTEVLVGSEAQNQLCSRHDVDIVVSGIVGIAGLESAYETVKAGKSLLLANKESLVVAGSILMAMAKKTGAKIIPMDSEHNAVYQCAGLFDYHQSNQVQGITLTASGGAFIDMPVQDLKNVTPDQACKHPNWSMGRKISVDSSTMMNKALELIEAAVLFGCPEEKIEVLIHRQSIIHAFVHYIDGSSIAQMSYPDMRVPISYALAEGGERLVSGVEKMHALDYTSLSFEMVDLEQFPALSLARQAVQSGGDLSIVLNAANEVAVQYFLERKILFTDIYHCNHYAMQHFGGDHFSSIEDVVAIDLRVRKCMMEYIDHNLMGL